MRGKALAVLLTVLHAMSLSAQISRTSGSLTVTVTDKSGAAIPSASVQIRNQENGQLRISISGSNGQALVTELTPGVYDMIVEEKGFSSATIKGVQIGLGRQATATVQLNPEGVSQEVTVSAAEPMFDPGQTSVTTSIDTERIEESPVATRNYLDFVLLAPGLSASNQQAKLAQGIPQTDSGFSFAGQRPRSNTLYIDSAGNNDEFTGGTRTELSLELVREFQVVNNGLAAESGGGSGGSINVITRSGSNVYHGDAFIFIQNGALNAIEPFLNETERPTSNKFRGGLAVGGPIVKNKTFFYVAGEQERKADETSSAIDPMSAATLNSILATGVSPGLPTRQLRPGFSPSHRAETEASGRLDHQFKNSTAALRYSFNNNREAGDAFNTGALNDARVRGGTFTEDHSLIGGVTSIFSQSIVNDAHLQLSTRRVAQRSNQTLGPEIDIVGLARFGRPYDGNLRRHENHVEFSDALTISRDQHLFKVGADFDHIHENLQSQYGTGGVYTFLSVSDFAGARPYQFRQRFGSPEAILGVTKVAGFLQDHWTVAKGFTTDIGVRYDFEQLPERFNQDANNIAPRVGVAFSPRSDLVFRGGFGIFYDRYPLAFLSQAILNDGVNGFEQVFDLNRAIAVSQMMAGGSLITPQPIPRSDYAPEPNMRTSYSEQANAGVEQVLFRNTTMTATYLFSKGVHLSRARNVNLAPPVVLTTSNSASLGIAAPVPQQIARPVFVQSLTSGIGDIIQLENRAGSTYHGGFLGLRSKLSNDVDITASYTLSKCLDDASDYYEQPQNPLNLGSERAFCAFDQRHRFVLSGLFELGEEDHGQKESGWAKALSNIQLAPIVTIGSSRPLDPITGFDVNLSHAFPNSTRPLGYPRNSLRTGMQSSIDLRVLKYFKIGERWKLDLVAEAFNLLNHPNVVLRQNEFGPNLQALSGFNRPITATTARQVQFSIDLEF